MSPLRAGWARWSRKDRLCRRACVGNRKCLIDALHFCGVRIPEGARPTELIIVKAGQLQAARAGSYDEHSHR
jgi:hypothetical protein